MFVKLLKYALIVLLVVASINIFWYFRTITRDSLTFTNRYITIFTQATEGRFGVFIFPKQQYILFFIDSDDYIEMIESDTKSIAILDNTLRIYIPPNKVFINHNGEKFLLQENIITHLKNFSGFSNVYIYYGDNELKEKFNNDSKLYSIRVHS